LLRAGKADISIWMKIACIVDYAELIKRQSDARRLIDYGLRIEHPVCVKLNTLAPDRYRQKQCATGFGKMRQARESASPTIEI
jgi:hypothetical protein